MTAVLVVDDDTDIRELVAFKLARSGYDVRTAADGDAGLEAALAAPPDLVVLDVMMPGLSGITVCRRLREAPATATTPILLLTAKAQEGDVEAGFAAGADDYITKPFSPRELVSRVEAVLARVRA